MKNRDEVNTPVTTGLGLGFSFRDNLSLAVKGDVQVKLIFPCGKEEVVLRKENIYTLDGGVLAAMLFKGEAGVGALKVLAVGTGAKGEVSSPDIATDVQRRLNTEIKRKDFSSIVYRKADGTTSSVPTNVIDFTTVFSETEANSGLNEMGLIANEQNPSTPNDQDMNNPYDPTKDVRNFDILVNYLTFPVINKPQGSVLAITWRLTF